MATVSRLTAAGDHFIIGEYDEYTIRNDLFYATSFNGSNQYIEVAATHTVFAATSENFTIEAWVYLTSLSTYAMVCGWNKSGFDYFTITSTSANLNMNNTYNTNMNFSFSTNTWYHVAFSRTSNIVRGFVNGNLLFTGSSDSASFGSGSVLFAIGRWYTTPNYYFPGYISNFRFVKGTGVYTSSFTPSTVPLTAVTNTSLLTCQNQILVDNSTNRYTISNLNSATTLLPSSNWSKLKSKQFSNGDLDVTGEFDEYTYYQDNLKMYSNQLNPTALSQYISPGFTSPTSQIWTMECWVYFTSYLRSTGAGGNMGTVMSGSNNGNGFGGIWWLFTGTASTITNLSVVPLSSYSGYNLGVGGLNLQLNTWYHIAASRNGGTGAIWINGVKTSAAGNGSTASYNAFPMRIGAALDNPGYTGYFPGYISNFRLVEGSNVYNITGGDITVPTTPLKAIAGTTAICCQSSTITGGVNGPTVSTFVPFEVLKTSRQFSNGTFAIIGNFDEVTGII
jgi:hypothetical protein